jgi:hypothetical protein
MSDADLRGGSWARARCGGHLDKRAWCGSTVYMNSGRSSFN